MFPVILCIFHAIKEMSGNSNGPLLLYITKEEVRSTDVSRPGKNFTIAKGLEKGLALDFYYEGQIICWSDYDLEKIKCVTHNGSHVNDKSGFVIPGVISYGLTIDWYTQKLYWTDRDTDKIEVASLTHNHRKVLFWSDLDEPRAIGVAPMDGLLFWTDWGEVAKIERSSMDGDPNTRKIIVDTNIFWPNALTIDYQAKKIYWLDAKLYFIDVMDYDGHNRHTIKKDVLGYAVSLTMFNDKLYWADWKTWNLSSWDISTKGPSVREIIHSEKEPTDVKVWMPQRQPSPNTTNPCFINNGNCSHLCLLSSSPPGYSCACPTGVKFINNFQCADGPQSQLILVQKARINRISLDCLDYTSFVLPLKDIKSAVTVDYNAVNGYIYWVDSKALTISSSKLDGSNQSVVIQGNLASPDGIAVDSVAGNIYWTDSFKESITVARLDGSMQKVLVNENLSNPRAIAVAPSLGWMFWSDWSNHKIERGSLDGSDRVLLVSKDLMWPNGIALDIEERKIYWGDAMKHNIEVCNMDGTDRRELLGDNLPHIFGVTLLGDYIYWTDWQRRSLSRVHKHTGGERKVLSDQFDGVMGLKAFTLNEKLVLNPCYFNNGNCSHFCFNRPQGYTCSCPLGLEFGKDNKTCVKPAAFLLYVRKDKIGRLSIENSNNNASVLVNIKAGSALAVHMADSRLYWADSKLHSIRRSTINGSKIEKVINSTNNVNSLAVDWCGNNLYWTDISAQRIEVSKLDGMHRRTLIWNGLKKPGSIVLDPLKGYMYWSDFGKSIKRAEMDGSNPIILIDQIGKANALNIDHEKGKLIWITIDPSMIEMADLDGSNRKNWPIENKTPFALTLYQDYMFWSDFVTGDINTALIYSGGNRSLLYKKMDDITAMEIYHESKQIGTNPCSVNNGGCSHLCLSVPSIQNKINYRCACPTHYVLNRENKTCLAPSEFVLFSHRNGIGRLITGGLDCPDANLPILGSKSIRAIGYDSLNKNLYWVDGKTHSIRFLPENGGNELIIANGIDPNVDIAVDSIGRAIYFSCPETNTINVTRLDNATQWVGVVVRGEGIKPRHVVVHQTKRLLFWADVGNGLVMRSFMDGSKSMEIAQARNITALTVDPITDTVYWANSKQIYASNIVGNNKRMIWQGGNVTSLVVLKSILYWIDTEKQLMHLQLNKKDAPARPALKIPNVLDVVAVYKIDMKHPCANGGGCSGVCMADGCGCVQGLLSQGARCSMPAPCNEDHFVCNTIKPSDPKCIPKMYRCDGHNDCSDGLDEADCKKCPDNKFQCSDNHCIELTQVCDGLQHCTGGDDEISCCSNLKNFRCPNTDNCINNIFLCDGIDHCADGSDETASNCLDNRVDHLQSNVKNSYVFGVVGIIVFIFIIFGFFYCRKRIVSKNNNFLPDDKALDPLSPKQMQHPHNLGLNCPSTSNNSKAAKMGRKIMEGMRMSALNGSSSNSYDRNHITGASSSATNGSSFIGRYPREPLNPPPSPATTTPSCTALPRHRPYRHYRVINQPPPPTPCSTDVCDESDCTMSYTMLGGCGMYLEAPPPTPCPPSPPSPSSRSSTYFSPLPPPPSPVPHHYDS